MIFHWLAGSTKSSNNTVPWSLQIISRKVRTRIRHKSLHFVRSERPLLEVNEFSFTLCQDCSRYAELSSASQTSIICTAYHPGNEPVDLRRLYEIRRHSRMFGGKVCELHKLPETNLTADRKQVQFQRLF